MSKSVFLSDEDLARMREIQDAERLAELAAAARTLRDYFAAAALTGLVAKYPDNAEDHAKVAYLYADAMLAARGER